MTPLTPSNQPNESQSANKAGPEFVDQGRSPEEIKKFIKEALETHMPGSSKRIWSERRSSMLNYLWIIEHAMQPDLDRFANRA